MTKRALFSLFAGIATLSAVASDASAQTAPAPTLTFDTIDSYTVSPGYYTDSPLTLRITGVVRGESAASTYDVRLNTTATELACERSVLVMINRPGRFSLGFDFNATAPTYASNAHACTLTRRP